MKITKVEVFLTGTTWRNFLFVKLTTDEGLVGWGDGTLEWKESAVRDLILDFGRRYVIGMSPFNIEDLWFKLYQIEHNTGPIMFAAMAGIETAMWDLVGKALGQPVYNLVGGAVRKRVAGLRQRVVCLQGRSREDCRSSPGSGRPRLHGDEVRSLRSGRQGTHQRSN